MKSKKSALTDDPITFAEFIQFWVDHPTITLQRAFQDGGKKNLTKANGTPGIIRLEPRKDSKGRVIGFSFAPRSGELPPSWNGVTLAPMGDTPPIKLGAALSRWVNDTQHELEYAAALKGMVSELHKPKPPYFRLEGFFPVVDEETKSFNLDRVRIINIPKLVEDTTDLSLVVLSLIETHGLSSMQDGGGSGPP